ncbi:IclR family transcriptional regulator [Afipia sp. P52-10]|uniref:IclR family transcriptional regulator n=1 Tax=Afipia sp. P52-10 TaxID=1429916 RepID=UPI0003DEF4E1|nr:helix-turn-helix domain-containing protein [Afipia sp. P52-10]ETR76381.1 IclR family transcriptional regulator [Afipia sp. P52-10]
MLGPVRSVSQAFAILRLLARRGPLTLSGIGRDIGLSPSSCLNLLRTLVAEGALEREADGKRYRLADGWAGLAVLRDGEPERMVPQARPLLARFAKDHEATAGLWQVASGRVALIALEDSGAATRIHMVEGQRQPLGSGASGRAIAAGADLDLAELERRYAVVRWQKPLSFRAYAGQVAAARQRGYAIDDGFGHAGVCSLAAVIPQVEPAMCVTASVFARSRSEDELAQIGRALRKLAQTLSDIR